MKKSTHAVGATVYSINGHAGAYVAACANGHIVEPIYEDDDAEPCYDTAQTWREVFASPPTAKLHAEVAEVEKKLVAAQSALDALRTEARSADAEASAARKRIAARPDLADLDLWLQGKVTHIVSLGYHSFTIGTIEETLRTKDRDRELRLLSLLTDPKANRYWVGYAAYSDGSSSQTRCLLATSLEDAQERAAKHIQEVVRNDPRQNHGALAASAIRYGVAISDELRKAAADMEANATQHALDSARKELERARANFELAQARATK